MRNGVTCFCGVLLRAFLIIHGVFWRLDNDILKGVFSAIKIWVVVCGYAIIGSTHFFIVKRNGRKNNTNGLQMPHDAKSLLEKLVTNFCRKDIAYTGAQLAEDTNF